MHLLSSLTNRVPMLARLAAVAALMLLFVCTATSAQAQNWVSTATQAYPVRYLTNATYLGSVPASTSMHIVVGLQEQNASQVQPTLRAMLTPGNPLYGTLLTVPQFVAEFGPKTAQVQAAQNYLSTMGFSNVTVADNKLLIEADGTASTVEAAFNTSLAQYSLNGATVYLNTTPAQVPASLSDIVIAVLGLNNVVQLHSDLVRLQHTGPQPATAPCTPPDCPLPDTDNTTFTPQQYQIAYDAASPAAAAATVAGPSPNNCAPNCKKPPAGCANFTAPQLLSTGDCTAVGEIAEGDVTQSVLDLREFETQYSLPKVPVSIVYAGIQSPDTSGLTEWDLDTQYATGIANQVSHLYYYVATSLTDSDLGLAINAAVSQNKVKAFNISIGECEYGPYLDGAMVLDDEMFGEGALQGMTAFVSADDNGSACPSEGPNGVPLDGPPDTSYPASSPYVIAVGGTNLFTNANYTYDYEVAWEASGGGISYFETSPFWQSYTGSGSEPIVLSSEVGNRGVPDVSMCAGGTEEAICSAIVWSAPSASSPSYNNPVDVLGGGPQPTNTTGCTVAPKCIVSAWVTNSNDPSMTDISSNIQASFYFMPYGGGTPLTPDSASGLICLANVNNLIATTTYAQIATYCAEGGGVALLLYPVSNISAPSTIPVFAIATEALGNFLANTVGYNATTSISNYPIRIDAKTAPGPSSTLVGGTSLSAPLAMGSWARIESSHSNKLGFAGPLIYQLANGASTAPALPSSPYFNDVTLGGNGLFTAGPGYDYVTGLGSWDILVVNQNIPSTYPE
jgi:pseudomonalisin